MSGAPLRITAALGEDLVERASATPEQIRQVLEAQRHTLATLRDELPTSPAEIDLSHLGRAVQRLAESLRLVGDYAEALALQEEAIAIWGALDRPKAAHLVSLRRALTLHRLGHPDRAYAALDELEGRMEADDALALYADLAADYRARCLVADARLPEAQAEAERALALRERAGRARAQLAASRAMIDAIAKLRSGLL